MQSANQPDTVLMASGIHAGESLWSVWYSDYLVRGRKDESTISLWFTYSLLAIA